MPLSCAFFKTAVMPFLLIVFNALEHTFNVSHANNKTKRKFYPNLHKKSFYVPEEDAWITLKVCSKALKTINKNGITAVLKKAQDSGMIVIR